jgi:polyphosphate kinase
METSFLPTLPSLLARPGVPLLHRDLSWLQFNDRVLAEARQANNPLLERAKFLAVSASNLDEFFMIRFGSLNRTGGAGANPTEESHRLKVRDNVLETVAKFGAKQLEAYDLLTGELESEGVRLARQPAPEDPAYALGQRIFDEQVLPRLSPPEEFAPAKLAALENLQIGVVFEAAGKAVGAPSSERAPVSSP